MQGILPRHGREAVFLRLTSPKWGPYNERRASPPPPPIDCSLTGRLRYPSLFAFSFSSAGSGHRPVPPSRLLPAIPLRFPDDPVTGRIVTARCCRFPGVSSGTCSGVARAHTFLPCFPLLRAGTRLRSSPGCVRGNRETESSRSSPNSGSGSAAASAFRCSGFRRCSGRRNLRHGRERVFVRTAPGTRHGVSVA